MMEVKIAEIWGKPYTIIGETPEGLNGIIDTPFMTETKHGYELRWELDWKPSYTATALKPLPRRISNINDHMLMYSYASHGIRIWVGKEGDDIGEPVGFDSLYLIDGSARYYTRAERIDGKGEVNVAVTDEKGNG